ncbi:LamG-like jellyroll fold domain-containing protein [Arthrobacter sp. GMC3]|uniref:LamG-like jellyroll fold domain-containing protein n=1 Tax=Arthrobacter sp. GMC3 TaxID=2058894 RepID=UPI000CE4E188|nr:LamG-like jellyroll fold domain-containing protein [Arthrobacter sp. GMC3]
MRASAGLFGRFLVPLLLSLGLIVGAGLAPAGATAPTAPSSEDSTAAPDAPVSEAVAGAKAAETGRDVVVEAVTSPTERTVAHPDGTFTKTVNTEPVRMETATGWQEISTDLVTSVENGVKVIRPEMVPVGVTLGGGGSSVMSSLDDKAGHVLHQSWPFGNLPVPVIKDNTATYRSVLPGVDLIQIAHKSGVSQVLKIASADVAHDPRVVRMRIFLDSANTTVHDTGAGGLEARGKDSGETELRTAAGQWWDSSQTGASALDSGGPGLTRPFTLSLGSEAGKQTQVFGMGEILSSPDLVFPIYVDPDWSTARVSYLYVDSGYPNTSYWNGQYTDTTGHVGYLPSSWSGDGMNHITRTYYQFNTQPVVGKVILSARMNVWESWASSCTPTPVKAWVTGGINSGTTWNNQPGLLANVDVKTVAMGYPGCAAGTVGFDMGSATSWLSGSSQWAVALTAGNEYDPLGWKRFGNDATLSVTYNTPPNAPGVWSVTNALWTGTPWNSEFVTRINQPTFDIIAGDPDGDAGGAIKVYLTVRNLSGTAMDYTVSPLWTAGSGGHVMWKPSYLPDGKYFLEGQTADQQNSTSGVMRFDFTVDTTPPPAPVVSAVTGSINNPSHTDVAGVVGETPYTFSLGKGAGSYDVKGFVYAVTPASSTPTYPANLACDSRVKEYVVVCGGSAQITVAAVAETSTVTVWAFDTAMNVNTQVHSAPVSFTFNVPAKPAMLPSTVLPLSLVGGATVVNIETANGTPLSNGCSGSVDSDGTDPDVRQALQLGSAGDYARTGTGAVDTSQSFSMAGWFCSTAPAAGTIQSVVTQMAGDGSPGAGLRLGAGGLAELAQFSGANGAGMEKVSAADSVGAGTWYYVAAVSDRINRQLRITLSTSGYVQTWTVATNTATHLPSPTTQPVLLGASGPGGVGQFKGQIFNPILTAGVLTDLQFVQAKEQFGTVMGVKK